ncbi:MAG: hypothetical protein IIW93_04130 [Bacteroidaceae bacterium]|nr:hypothetical protein [Bacteroidaceae bacterium]
MKIAPPQKGSAGKAAIPAYEQWLDEQSAEEANTINSVKEENNSENSGEGEEKIAPLSLTEDNVYEQPESITRGIEAGTLRVRCLGEEMGRGRDNLCLSIGAIIASSFKKGDGNFGRRISPNASRSESQRTINEAKSRAKSILPPLSRWAKEQWYQANPEQRSRRNKDKRPVLRLVWSGVL